MQPSATAERTFNYTYLLVQTVREGACYCSTIPALAEGFQLLGQDCRTAQFKYRCFEVATIDAMFSAFEKHPDETRKMTGTSAEKALWRREITRREPQFPTQPSSRPRVGLQLNLDLRVGAQQSCLDRDISDDERVRSLEADRARDAQGRDPCGDSDYYES